MYVHVEHYIDDDDYANWLVGNGIEADVYALEDPDALIEYIETFGGYGTVVKVL